MVGTGFGCLTHVRTARAAGWDVVALVGRDEARTQARADRFGIPRASTSLADAVRLEGVTAVAISTPPHTHAPLAWTAIEQGKHVLCEKPFARDAAEGAALQEAAERAGLVNLLGTEFRWATGQAVMARAVRSGAIGDPRWATFLLHMPLLADEAAEVPAWWSDARQGGGWLGAHAAHVVDQVRDMLGDFDGVSADLPVPAGRGWSAEDGYSVRFRLRSGASGIMQRTAGDWGPIIAVSRGTGTRGTVWSEGDTVSLADATGTRTLPVPDELAPAPPDPPPPDLMTTAYDLMHSTGIDFGPYTRLYAAFRELVAGRPIAPDPRPATFADGVAAMEVLDAIRRSARTGTWESLPA